MTTDRIARLRRLHSLLEIDRPTEIVDIGANPIDGAPPYQFLAQTGLCRITGFEPDPAALAALTARTSAHETFLPYAIGDGATTTLNLCRYSGWTSALRPCPEALDVFPVFRTNAEVIRKEPLQTRRLDDIVEVKQIDYLKIDIQGGELDVFRHGTRKLAKAAVIQTEVSFVGLYENQPSFGEIDVELRRQGFIPHCFAALKHCMIAPLTLDNDPWRALNQLIEADIVYVRDFRYPDLLSNDQLRQTALIADGCYNSFDLALRCIFTLQQRQCLGRETTEDYLALVNQTLSDG